MALVGHQRPDLVHVPKMMRVGKPFHGFSRLWIALVSQFSVTIYRMTPAPSQFVADRRLARAGNPFDQIVSDTHPMFSSLYS